MNKFILLVISVVLMNTVMAQKEKQTLLSVGPELGFTFSKANTTNSFGYGASLQLEQRINDKFRATALVGIINYVAKSSPRNVFGNIINPNSKYVAVPLRVGGRYYFDENLHVGAQVGVGFNTPGTVFAYSPQIGYSLNIKNVGAFETTFKIDGYAGSGNFNSVGIRIAYIF